MTELTEEQFEAVLLRIENLEKQVKFLLNERHEEPAAQTRGGGGATDRKPR